MDSMSVHIFIFEVGESGESILQEIVALLSKRTDVQIEELSKRIECNNSKQEVLSYPGLEIHTKEQTIYKDGRLIPMSHYEFSTLYFLARHPGWVFTKQQIYEAVWNEPEGDCNTAITNIISQIRKKLYPDDPKSSCIKTVVNSGYKFEAPITQIGI